MLSWENQNLIVNLLTKDGEMVGKMGHVISLYNVFSKIQNAPMVQQ